MANNEAPSAAPEKWTEITLLPEWEEEFYLVYTAKKHGKWVMLKTLKPEYADKPEFKDLIEKEFDVRYNLAHPHIVMINDFEDVPGLGRCIITDDVYGDSLDKLIKENKVTPEIIEKLRHNLIDAIDYIQTNHIVHHPIRPERIIFTENIGNLKLIDVGFDQLNHMKPADVSEDIYNYGCVLSAALDAVESPDPALRKIARKCTDPDPKKRYHDVQDLHLALEGRKSSHLLLLLIAFLAIMALVLGWLTFNKIS
ncbi:MAG: protein kinase [Lachnospiraceae bacterium]|nr:protein kinase [Lachnospiraceae bacterium]